MKIFSAILLLCFLIIIGSKFLFGDKVFAKGTIQYKVVSSDRIGANEKYEALLNEMASQGWEYTGTMGSASRGEQWTIFKK